VTVFTVQQTDAVSHLRAPDNLCFISQTVCGPAASLATMSVKYYTQFRLTDEYYRGGNEFSGIVELSRPMDQNSDVSDIEAVLAKNFDLRRSSVKLVSWSRLH
jgi:hypothetical protein